MLPIATAPLVRGIEGAKFFFTRDINSAARRLHEVGGLHLKFEDSHSSRNASMQSCHAVNTKDAPIDFDRLSNQVGNVPVVNWYPGHIAKAERQLKEQLKLVDVVLEVRDARIPMSTSHPQISDWIGDKPRLLLMNRKDMVSASDRRSWDDYFVKMDEQVFWTVGNRGSGIPKVVRHIEKVSKEVNKKRAKRGLRPRPVRSCVIGFPNIGKSALINRLVKRRIVDSAPRPGVTRVLRWVRVGADLDLLDCPGVIPANFKNQIAAQRLAMCNDIGQASYIDSIVATELIKELIALNKPEIIDGLQKRYKVDVNIGSPEDFVTAVSYKLFVGDLEKAGARILKDFRELKYGKTALEVPAMFAS